MQDLIDFLFQFHKDAAPFISENEDGESYSLVGLSDKTASDLFDYGEFYGKCKLTARNHSQTLLSLMNFMSIIDALGDYEEISFEDEEVIGYVQFEFLHVMSSYFQKEISVYSHEVALQMLHDNPHLINEALYNMTKDKEPVKTVDYNAIVDGLEGTQFEDPYVNIAYEVAKEFKLRPMDVINHWATSELIVIFAKIANDHSLDGFLSWKYSQKNAPKRPTPKKQVFFFRKLSEEDEEEQENAESVRG